MEDAIKAQAHGLGFDLVGVTKLGVVETAPYFRQWIDDGFAGAMGYLERYTDLRADTRLPQDGMISAIVVGLDYGGRAPRGPVARYARGDDYHDLMWRKLDQLHAWIGGHVGRAVPGRGYVDTGPILERDLARRAGLGWFGKNTNLINPKTGSFFFIGALLVDLDLVADTPFEADRCGTCTRCLDACPTDAFVEARKLDATKCISYLTIELRDSIPDGLRGGVGENLYGCDICQDVCPWNVRFSSAVKESAFHPREVIGTKDARMLARELLGMNEDAYRSAFKGSAMKRAKLRGLRRNAAVVLGNVGGPDDFDVLARASEDPDAMVAEHAAWALERIRSGC